MEDALEPGLYIVATPIGNLGDMTARAISTLRSCALVACEDTRVTGKLFKHHDISARLLRYDDHADASQRDRLLESAANAPVALVSDAGTPLVSDPGFKLVRDARERGIAVRAVPGASAVLSALSIAGLPSDRFLFAGFLPAKTKARADVLLELGAVRSTLVFFETGPRLEASLSAIADVLPGREVAVARELTKRFEECRTGPAETLRAHYSAHPAKGEIVLLIGPPPEPDAADLDIDALLRAALADNKPSQAAAKVAREHGLSRKELYARALEL